MLVIPAPTYFVRASGAHSAVGDLLQISVPQGTTIFPLRAKVTSSTSETPMQAVIKLSARGTAGSGGSSATVIPTDPNYVASACACLANNTVDASGSEPVIITRRAMDVVGVGWYWHAEDMDWRITGSATLVLNLNTTLDGRELQFDFEWAEL